MSELTTLYPKLKLHKDWIIIDIEERGMSISTGGIFLMDDDMKNTGIKPRWSKVINVSQKVYDTYNIKSGDMLLVEHLGWTKSVGRIEDVNGKKRTLHATKIEKVIIHDPSRNDALDREVQATPV